MIVPKKSYGDFSIKTGSDDILTLSIGNLPSDPKLTHLVEWAKEVEKTIKTLYQETGRKVKSAIDLSRTERYLTGRDNIKNFSAKKETVHHGLNE